MTMLLSCEDSKEEIVTIEVKECISEHIDTLRIIRSRFMNISLDTKNTVPVLYVGYDAVAYNICYYKLLSTEQLVKND